MSRSLPIRGDFGLDVSRFLDDVLSPFRFGGVLGCGIAGTIAIGWSIGDGSGDRVCCVVSFTDRRGVDILVSVGLAQFVHMISWFRDR